MKIAVYTIALNEEKHVKRWFESAKDADLLVIADTGSTDKTRFIAKSLGISVTEIEVNPWRFDVARNASLALIPEDFDVCIQLDMDEILPAGWRKKVEDAFEEGNTWPIYKHVTSRYPDGKPRNYQHYFKIHPRKGFYWKYPIHEVLAHLPELNFDRKVIDLEVDHIKDLAKPRNSYLSLLEKAVEEDPNDWRMNHYLNREYFYNRDWLKVLQSAYQCESIPGGWDIERASSYMWASEAANHLKMAPLAEDWAKKATTAAPHFYEVWHWRAHIAHLNKKWPDCLDFASKRLILKRQDHHLVKPEVWEWWGYDLIALSNHYLGNHEEAVFYGEKASFASNDERLKKNLEFYRSGVKNNLTTTALKSKKSQIINAHEIPESPQGGSEILLRGLQKYTKVTELPINIIMSRCDESRLDKSKINVLWQHLDVDQLAVAGIESSSFTDHLDSIVFVSDWQMKRFVERFNLPIEKCRVIRNAIEDFDFKVRDNSEVVKLIYTSTPWRGLEALLDAVEILDRDDFTLDIFSSTAVYGRTFYEANDHKYHDLYDRAGKHSRINYRGYVPNDILRNELFNFDIFAYPSTWAETFCMSAVEAGASGLRILVSDLGALPEILSDRAEYVPYGIDVKNFVPIYAQALDTLIDNVNAKKDQENRRNQHKYFISNYSWSLRKNDWDSLFDKLLNENVK